MSDEVRRASFHRYYDDVFPEGNPDNLGAWIECERGTHALVLWAEWESLLEKWAEQGKRIIRRDNEIERLRAALIDEGCDV